MATGIEMKVYRTLLGAQAHDESLNTRESAPTGDDYNEIYGSVRKALAVLESDKTIAEASGFAEEEEYLLVQALHALLKVKNEALAVVAAAQVNYQGKPFTEADFGIPQIRALIERFS